MPRKSELESATALFEKMRVEANADPIEPNQTQAEIAKALGIDLEHKSPWGMPNFEAHLAGGLRRDLYIQDYGFALLTRECLDELERILKGKRCLDAGAGTGYLAHQLTLREVNVVASEKFVSENNYGFSKIWQNDHNGDTLELLPGDFDVVLLSWPPYERAFGMDVASRMHTGQVLVYQGEGMGGCTGTDDFHEVLADEAQWDYLAEDAKALNTGHVQFPGIHDRWRVYRKR